MANTILGTKESGLIMGDRAMAEIKVSDGSLYFYTHWAGEALPEMAEIALSDAQVRINDEPYALRIVVDSLLRESGTRDSEIGSGLMLGPNAEDEYNGDSPSVIIDLVANKIRILGPRHKGAEPEPESVAFYHNDVDCPIRECPYCGT